MINFSVAKNGYNKKEVELYIKDLLTKVEDLEQKNQKLENELKFYQGQKKEIKEKNESISIALTAAVEKAKQIEKSSNNVYKLKIQQLNLLYSKWEKLLDEIVDKYPQIEQVENVQQLLTKFKDDIKNTLKDDFKLCSITSPVKTDNDTIRLLLKKLNTYPKDEPIKTVKVERKQLSKDMLTSQTELNRIEDKASLIKPICNTSLNEKTTDGEDLADKFLEDDSIENNAYANIITSKVGAIPEVNESGFDLKEAINPKDDLAYAIKSRAEFELGKIADAEADNEMAIKLNNCPEYQFDKAKILYKNGNYQQAKTIFKELLPYIQTSKIYEYMGYCDLEMKNYVSALMNIDKALILSDDDLYLENKYNEIKELLESSQDEQK